jgi:AcrR family transcriptional regulator
MARPKTVERRNAILDAASETIALRGVSASTAAVAQKAEVSEGTIFTYFTTKDELLNALYRELKLEIASLFMSGFPRRATVQSRIQHIWNRYVEWGTENFSKFQALQQLTIWAGLSDEAKAAGIQQFENIRQIYADAVAQHLCRDSYRMTRHPVPYPPCARPRLTLFPAATSNQAASSHSKAPPFPQPCLNPLRMSKRPSACGRSPSS